MKKTNIEKIARTDVVFCVQFAFFLLLFLRFGYKCGYDIAKTQDALMCVRDCMPYPYQ